MVEIFERVTSETLASQQTISLSAMSIVLAGLETMLEAKKSIAEQQATEPRFSKEHVARKKELESFARLLSIAEKKGVNNARELAEIIVGRIKGKAKQYEWAGEFASEKFLHLILTVGIRDHLEKTVQDVRQKIFDKDPIFTETDTKIRYAGGYLERKSNGQLVADIHVFPPFLADSNYSTEFRARIIYPHTDESGNVRTISVGDTAILEWKKPLSKFEAIKLEIPILKSAPDQFMAAPQKQVFQVEVVVENTDPSKKYEERYRRILIPSTEFLRIDRTEHNRRENN